ncbi:MAG: glutamate-5-semialdehyde dehydrogenase [Alphaproteobacteria bacterium]|nr:MAG: glutamate-5-semialdehyde dehydrogenase [Alphaproteobacteria bacterium]
MPDALSPTGSGDLATLMTDIGRRARAASAMLATAGANQRRSALVAAARHLRAQADTILAANAEDLARASDLASNLRDRLALSPQRVEAMAQGLDDIAAQPDPVGEVMEQWTRPNGLHFSKVRVPLGVIGVIYESRPNVTADAGALCIKSGNAAILRGGSESAASSAAILACLRQGLADVGLPEDAVQGLPTTDRAAVGHLLRMAEYVDVIVPRGGKGLIARVQEDSRVPVLAHLDGNCHVYVHQDADLEMAAAVLLNAKLRRTSVCGATESLLIDGAIAARALPRLVPMLLEAGCAVRGDGAVQAVDPRVTAATDADWGTEYLDAVLSAAVVPNLSAAIAWINRHGSHHTDAIITQSQAAADQFLAEVDSAIVLVNASTQFADGGEFGFGAEIGISTGRLHARGPVGARELTSFKYQVRGTGQVRP